MCGTSPCTLVPLRLVAEPLGRRRQGEPGIRLCRTEGSCLLQTAAELLLRRTGLIDGTGSVADGQAKVAALFAAAGVPRTAFDFSDGSGMSTYNRIAPRGMVTLLDWIARQPWGAAWRETLPVGGVDGTLARRLKGTALEGRTFVKPGSINATNPLSGYTLPSSGKVYRKSVWWGKSV